MMLTDNETEAGFRHSTRFVKLPFPHRSAWQVSEHIGTFFDNFKDSSIDVVITDPPYPMETGKHMITKGSQWRDAEGMYDQLTRWQLARVIETITTKLTENGVLYLFTNREHREWFKETLETAGLKVRQEIVWVKRRSFKDGAAMGYSFLNGVEYILYATKAAEGIPRIADCMNVFIEVPPVRGRNSKPEGLYSYLTNAMLRAWRPAGKVSPVPLIVDPFGGSDPLNRAALNNEIPPDVVTVSNVFNCGDETDPAVFGLRLREANLNQWFSKSQCRPNH